MTQVEYFSTGSEISIKVVGHAGYATHGSDIVCAAISVLIQTLIAQMEKCSENTNNFIEPGNVWCYARGGSVDIILDTILTGFELIESAYPDYIRVNKGCTLLTYPNI